MGYLIVLSATFVGSFVLTFVLMGMASVALTGHVGGEVATACAAAAIGVSWYVSEVWDRRCS